MSHRRCGWIILWAGGLLAACGGGSGSSSNGLGPNPLPPLANDPCGVAAQKQFVLDRARDAYLFLELLPQNIDPAQYATADALLDALTATARAQRKDRYFSYLTSISAEQQFFAAGESIGFGISLSLRENTRVFVIQVYEGSEADLAGFRRGDEILEIGTSASTMQKVPALLASGMLGVALGPNEVGVTRVLRVRTLEGVIVDRTVTKRSFSLDPVPATALIQREGMTPVGYVNLRTFISPADQPLRQAFAEFSAQNVTDVVVDLRYNGGGLVSTAELLANLLSHGREGEVLYRVRRNSNYASQNETVPFGNAAQAIPAARIAFLTTEASASASELVINSLAPYVETAIIGTPTYGKPVGQSGFDLDGCDVRLRLVTFQLVNRDGFGDYFDGLPDAHFPDAFCSAADDLTHAQEDPAEAMLSEALHWIDHGVCRATARLHAEGTLPGTSSGLLPLPQRPAPAQVYQPGFH